MEEKEKQINFNSRRDTFDDSHLFIGSEINLKRYEDDKKEFNPKLEIIEEETNNYIEDIKKGTYNIMVAVRCRPLWNKEREFSEFEIIKILDKKMVILMDPYEYNAPTDVFKNRSREQNYAFDFAFDRHCNQQTVFTYTTKFLLEGVVNGYNATVFAYGATGAGKTYTMLGNEEEPGIMPLTLQELFNKMENYSTEREYKVKLWYIEIYNENIRDLLTNTDEYLDLREDPSKGVSIVNISELNVTSCKDILQILKKGNKNRTQESTCANETSSRSHAIMQVNVEYKEKITGMEAEIKAGKLSLIDLAGSERASATQNRGIRLIEGANINRSLLTLGNCINALCEANEKGTKPYVPYRDSKLTRLLKDSLGGNSRTVMIANVSPSVTTFDDTYNTLKYANRAKNIKTHVQRNVLSVQYHISNYNNIINNLKSEITELKQQLAKVNNPYQMNIGNKNNSDYVNIQKKEEIKDNNVKDNLLGNNKPGIGNAFAQANIAGNNLFEKYVQELKSHCEEEISLKIKIINQQQEINNLTLIIKNFQNVFNLEKIQNRNSNLDLKEYNKNLATPTIDKVENPLVTDGNSVIAKEKEELMILEDKDIILNNSDNYIQKDNKDIYTINSSSRTRIGSAALSKNLNLREKEIKLAHMKKFHENNSNKLKDLVSKRDSMMINFNKMAIKEFYFEYLQIILKAHISKLRIVENKFKEKLDSALFKIKDSYISELENQVRLRDEIIKRHLINIYEDEENLVKIKTIEHLKMEYTNKLPIIPLSNQEVNNKGINIDQGNENLPPIFGKERNLTNNPTQIQISFTNNINSILSDVKNVNNNINKIEMNQALKKDKSKIRNEFTVVNNKDIVKEKINQARNYSQGIRNLNKNVGSANGNNSSMINSNIPQSNNQYNTNNVNNLLHNSPNQFNNLHSNPIHYNNISVQNQNNYQTNQYTLNQRVQLTKNGSSKQIKTQNNRINYNQNNNISIINRKNKDSNSEKSANQSNNNSRENDLDQEGEIEESCIIEIENNNNNSYDENLNCVISGKEKNRNNNFYERKKSGINREAFNPKEESPNNVTPNKRELQFNNKFKRDDSSTKNIISWNDNQPHLKKRDLNVYLNGGGGKSKNHYKKLPFKI